MKLFVAILLLALAAISCADKPAKAESVEPLNAEVAKDAVRDKRGVVVGAAYTAPAVAYTAPVAYSAGYSLPYAYSGYRAYPYYSPVYTSSYYVA